MPTILISDQQMKAITGEAMAALEKANANPSVFVRSGKLCRLRVDEHQRPIIEPFTESALRGQLERAATFRKRTTKGSVGSALPPSHVVKDILALPNWPFPPIAGIIEMPALRRDGSIISMKGYDRGTGLYYWPKFKLPDIPQHPTQEQVRQALAFLEEAIGEFPYQDDASRANAVALMLTPIVRPAICGCVPLALIDAPQQGTGKTLLTKVLSLITTGRSAAMIAAPDNDEEWRKRITSTLLKGATVVTIDNLSTKLDSGSLASVLSAELWEDRILGASEMVSMEQRATWMATGNNIRLGGDIQRRCYWIRLDARNSKPWMGRVFKHPHLEMWVKSNRGPLVAALLTLARAWYTANKPKSSAPRIGGFEEWCDVVGGILEHSGVKGFLGNLEGMYADADEEAQDWREFLLALQAKWPVTFTTGEVAKDLENSPALVDLLPTELAEDWGRRGQGGSFARRFGKALAGRKDRRYGTEQLRLEDAGEQQGAKVWRIVSDAQPEEEMAPVEPAA